jgi:lipopolysaccharide transport system ATP-binding protein
MTQSPHSESTSDEIAISVKGLSKAYRIWRDPTARLKAPLWEAIGSIVPSALRPNAVKKRLSHAGQSRYYTDFYALEKLDLEIKKGEAVGIIGRNGSGKSTLLQMLAGTLTPTTGQIQVNGRVAALLELGSGFNPEFTGRENVYLNASVLGLKESEIDAKLQTILDFADIGDFVDQPVKTYSSGMTMRLAFAVIANVNADILIVDEALAVGDVFFIQKCMRFIREFQKEGTLILVTHDTASVQSICNSTLWLHKGQINAIGDTKSITEKYLEATYAERQGTQLFKRKQTDESKQRSEIKHTKRVDQRAALINNSNLRNDLAAFKFNEDSAAFGARGATITNVELIDQASKQPLAYGIGGEEVILRIHAEAHTDLNKPIIGFHLKNKNGQELFGDNTYLSYEGKTVMIDEGQSFFAEFHFQMPYLPSGNYSFCTALANGTQAENIQHHWLHDGLIFKSQSTHVARGLVGMPMTDIKLIKNA